MLEFNLLHPVFLERRQLLSQWTVWCQSSGVDSVANLSTDYEFKGHYLLLYCSFKLVFFLEKNISINYWLYQQHYWQKIKTKFWVWPLQSRLIAGESIRHANKLYHSQNNSLCVHWPEWDHICICPIGLKILNCGNKFFASKVKIFYLYSFLQQENKLCSRISRVLI